MGDIWNGVKDIAFGKKDPGQAEKTVDTNTAAQYEAQAPLLGQFQGMANQDFGQLAQNQTDAAENQVRQNAVDNQSKAVEMIARRGLGGTSIGLNASLTPGRRLGEDIGAVRAGRLGLENQLRQQGLGFASKGINDIYSMQNAGKIYQPAVASTGRGGGLVAAGLGALGAIKGGSGGAQAGLGIGKAIANV